MPWSHDTEEIRLFSAYCEAIAVKVREGAPLDTYSIDRRAIVNYTEAAGDDSIFSLICFSCALMGLWPLLRLGHVVLTETLA